MKKIVLNLAVSLDGFIEGPNGETDWCIMADDMGFEDFLQSIDTIFYGRVSYDAWGNYQPESDADASEKDMWNEIHSKQKIVFSHQDRSDENANFITSDIIDKVDEIKKQNGKDIWLYGGANLIKTFIRLGLIDVYKISLHPVVLGKGKPLFEDLKNRIGLKLLDTRIFKSGVIELTYQPE
ncbi:dihydrofolate reductase family protein [Elizabethkingia anophelis]